MNFLAAHRDITSDEVREVTKAPLANILVSWPLLREALAERGMRDFASQVAAAATVAVEVPAFMPVHELGKRGYFLRLYENRRDLGNTEPGDGALYHGRGYIQITGRGNYRRYGALLGVDLEANPDLALDPFIAAKILAAYFSLMKVNDAAVAGDWLKVRRLVNGGLNGWPRFNMVQQQFISMVLK